MAAAVLRLGKTNPQAAARLVRCFNDVRKNFVAIPFTSMDKLKEEIARKKREREEALAGCTVKTHGKYVKMGFASKTVAAEAALPESKGSLQSSESLSSLAVEAKPTAGMGTTFVAAMAKKSEKNSSTASKTRKGLGVVYANRVTFKVQSDITVTSSADDAEDPHLRMLSEWSKKTQASKYDGPEAEWLKTFSQHVMKHDRQLERRLTPSAVQALYHSSALPLLSRTGLNSVGVVPNGLIGACLMAFTRHKRLVLRPDDIFFPLLDAAATHVFQNGEASRSVFVGHTGKKDLVVIRDNFAPPDSAPNVNDWAGTLPEFRAKLHQNVRAGSVDAALPNFSTSDAITSAAFTCTLMHSLQNFFTYSCMTLCGIPEVTLLGTVADWTDLHARFLVLAETWMQRTPATCAWARTVDTFLKKFIAARKGRVDVEWWISLFTYHGSKGSGTEPYVTGHINALFPWAEPEVSYGSKAPAHGKVWVGLQRAKESFPGGMNTVPMTWNYLGQQIPMTAWSGSMCACVSEDGREVAPAVCVGFTINSATDDPSK